MLKVVSRLAFHTLPPALQDLYGVRVGVAGRVVDRSLFATARVLRPFLPKRFRFIEPYQAWVAGGRRAASATRMADSPS